jgi:hypothetical protein
MRSLDDSMKAPAEKGLSRKGFLRRLALAGAGTAALGVVGGGPSWAHTGAPGHGGYQDAVTHLALDELKIFTSWLGGAGGYIGEVGFPQNTTRSREQFAPDEERWARLGEAWYSHADAKGLWVTAQECSERYNDTNDGGYHASLWMSVGEGAGGPNPIAVAKPGYQAALVKRHLRVSGAWRGVNFSGGQRWEEGIHSNRSPGVYGDDYWYPTVNPNPSDPAVNGGRNSFGYLRSEGVGLVRVGFRWERLQPVLGGGLEAVELARLKASIRNAGAAGLKVVLDCHNYGGYWTAATGGHDGTGKQALNSPGCTVVHFRDLWKRLSSQFASDPTVIVYDLMNEPNGKKGIVPARGRTQGQTWEAITRSVVSDIRGRGDRTTIAVTTYRASVDECVDHHPNGPWIPASIPGIRYTAHQYFDHYSGSGTGGGNYVRSYEDENAHYAAKGY